VLPSRTPLWINKVWIVIPRKPQSPKTDVWPIVTSFRNPHPLSPLPFPEKRARGIWTKHPTSQHPSKTIFHKEMRPYQAADGDL